VRIVVDFEACASNGVCQGIAPSLFEVRSDGYLYVLDDHPGEEQRALLTEVVNSCPTSAISLVEE
jgi:ferredoxin